MTRARVIIIGHNADFFTHKIMVELLRPFACPPALHIANNPNFMARSTSFSPAMTYTGRYLVSSRSSGSWYGIFGTPYVCYPISLLPFERPLTSIFVFYGFSNEFAFTVSIAVFAQSRFFDWRGLLEPSDCFLEVVLPFGPSPQPLPIACRAYLPSGLTALLTRKKSLIRGGLMHFLHWLWTDPQDLWT